MLQINSGKLYPDGVGRTNKLRGVLYTNLMMTSVDDEPLVTKAGTLLETDIRSGPKTLVYELTEQMEGGPKAAGILISHTVAPYLEDFAVITAFFLEVTCTPDADLCARLLSGKRSLSVSSPPNKLVKRVFEPDVWLQPADRAAFPAFVDDLIGLQRKSFLAAMRAIRTYVTGLHRVADDVELAYTLFVAAIESLAQGFDGHQGRWFDYEDGKRRKIDTALEGADPDVAERVRQALVDIEHLALTRRFRDFALEYTDGPDAPTAGRVGVPGRLDLRDALKEAYRLRSRYVHSLEDLPGMLGYERGLSEIIRTDHRTFLTLQGLAHHTRRIILEFIRRQPKVETEVYNYSSERFGVIRAQLAPEYWIGRPEGVVKGAGRVFLEGFLDQFAAFLLSSTPVTNLTDVVAKIEEQVSSWPKTDRVPFEALYVVYNVLVGRDLGSPNFLDFQARFTPDLQEPSVENLFVYDILERVGPWDLARHQDLIDSYFGQRNSHGGFRAPELLEAAVVLGLAERYRQAGNEENARSALDFAKKNFMGFGALSAVLDNFDPAVAIDWGSILLPNRSPQAPPADDLPDSDEPSIKDDSET